jgi:aspartate aminotransferase-like enzyme
MLDIQAFDQINPPARLLMGPGPINADPRVLRAMSSQLIGQYDPAMTEYMNQTMALYRALYKTNNEWTFLIDGTSRAGIEAMLVSAIHPGDKVLVPVFGRFGDLLCEIARSQPQVEGVAKDDLGTLMQKHTAGDTLAITVARDGQMQTVNVTLGEKTASNS